MISTHHCGVADAALDRQCELVPGSSRADDYYEYVWSRIKERAPRAVLLRGPVHFHPVQPSPGGHDLDILLSHDLTPVRTLLKQEGCDHVYKPQTYLERLRLCAESTGESYTIDLYKVERWGLGFRTAKKGSGLAGPSLACLIHAVADGKGTGYFERQLNGVP